MKKIRMVAFNNGEIVSRKYIDFKNNMVKEKSEGHDEVIVYNLDAIIKSFGTIEKYINYNMRVWNYSLLDSLN